MQVTFKVPQTLGNKNYKSGLHIVPDHLSRNVKFKDLVKSGHAIVHPKDANTQAIQAAKDAQNARKAQIARELSVKLKEKHQSGADHSEMVAVVKDASLAARTVVPRGKSAPKAAKA